MKTTQKFIKIGILVVLGSSASRATTLTISDGLASFRYNDSIATGDFFVYGSSGNTLYQEAWYLNLSNRALLLKDGTLSAQSANSATITYSPSGFYSKVESVAITYSISDTGSAGLLGASVAVRAANSDVSFSLINYFDYDLKNFGNDSATFDAATGRMTISDGDSNPAPDVVRQGNMFDSWEIAAYSGLQTRIANGQLLSGSGAPFGPGDFTGAMQWNFSLQSNQTQVVNAGGAIGEIGAELPEPSHLVPLGLLLAAPLLRRRRDVA